MKKKKEKKKIVKREKLAKIVSTNKKNPEHKFSAKNTKISKLFEPF